MVLADRSRAAVPRPAVERTGTWASLTIAHTSSTDDEQVPQL